MFRPPDGDEEHELTEVQLSIARMLMSAPALSIAAVALTNLAGETVAAHLTAPQRRTRPAGAAITEEDLYHRIEAATTREVADSVRVWVQKIKHVPVLRVRMTYAELRIDADGPGGDSQALFAVSPAWAYVPATPLSTVRNRWNRSEAELQSYLDKLATIDARLPPPAAGNHRGLSRSQVPLEQLAGRLTEIGVVLREFAEGGVGSDGGRTQV